MSSVPRIRLRVVKDRGWRGGGEFVVYWMHSARRLSFNYALQRAVEVARDLGKPLLIVEELLCGQRWDNDRLHKFALDGMREKLRRLRDGPILYYPFVEQRPKQADRLAALVSKAACGLITDDFPCVGLPNRADALAACCAVRVEAVDSNGLLPLQATEKIFNTAASFRRFLQAALLAYLDDRPVPDPLRQARLPRLTDLPEDITRWFPPAPEKALAGDSASLARLPIDHSVTPAGLRGGEEAARRVLRDFLSRKLKRYAELRNHPDADATSGLAPYLHFGHISAQEVFGAVAESQDWTPDMASRRRDGRRQWWGMGESAEAFLDQLVTWRELGYNMAWHQPDCDKYEALPEWAQATLDKHSADPRPYIYSPEELEAAQTHDDLWNAAQRQLVREGRIHNYVRMLWGKKILEWSPRPRDALAVMIDLNNRYALDGRNPNSYSGIFWCLGRYDHPWPPERPIFGTVRYMSSRNTLRKVRVREYLGRYAQ